MRRQSELAAGDEIELARLAKGLQHDGAERIAGQRIRRGAQRRLDIGGAHGDEQARIEAKLGKPVRRQRAGFKFRKILPHPDQRFSRTKPSCDGSDETGRRRALMPLGEYFMHGSQREPAAQHRIRRAMTKRDLVQRMNITRRFDALDAAAQGRKRADACAAHAHRSSRKWGQLLLMREPEAGSFVHDMF